MIGAVVRLDAGIAHLYRASYEDVVELVTDARRGPRTTARGTPPCRQCPGDDRTPHVEVAHHRGGRVREIGQCVAPEPPQLHRDAPGAPREVREHDRERRPVDIEARSYGDAVRLIGDDRAELVLT